MTDKLKLVFLANQNDDVFAKDRFVSNIFLNKKDENLKIWELFHKTLDKYISINKDPNQFDNNLDLLTNLITETYAGLEILNLNHKSATLKSMTKDLDLNLDTVTSKKKIENSVFVFNLDNNLINAKSSKYQIKKKFNAISFFTDFSIENGRIILLIKRIEIDTFKNPKYKKIDIDLKIINGNSLKAKYQTLPIKELINNYEFKFAFSAENKIYDDEDHKSDNLKLKIWNDILSDASKLFQEKNINDQEQNRLARNYFS